MFYSMDKEDGSQLRVSGSPIRLVLPNNCRKDYLHLVVNHVVKPRPAILQVGHVLSEEYVIDERAISTTIDIVGLDEKGSFDTHHKGLAPVIWGSKAQTLEIFRGKQDYNIPLAMAGDIEAITQQQFMSDLLADYVLPIFRPGTHDAQYPL
jgi:hypothetical protein